MQKEYCFYRILEEYNKIYENHQRISSKICSATIVHTIESGSYHVVFEHIDKGISTTRMDDFAYRFISDNIHIQSIMDIICSKEKEESNIKIEIWPPNKIRYAYLLTNYFSGAGILGNSCMRCKENQKALNFYVKNDVRIVVAVDDKNKIHARALLWDGVNSTERKKPFTYLDRVYANSTFLVSQFHNLARGNKWKFYSSLSAGKACKHYYKNGINTTGICHFPYTDTFRHLYYKDNVIASDHLNKVKDAKSYIYLTVAGNGGYFPQLDPNTVQEVFSNSFISKKDAIFVKRYKGWVLKEHIADIKGAYYSRLDTNITKTTADGWILVENSVHEVLTNERIDKTKAVKSVKYNGYVHESNSLYIKNELYHKLDTNVVCFNDEWYHISECFMNYSRKEVNKELAKKLASTVFSSATWVPYELVTRTGDLIPKKHAIIAHNLIYNPMIDGIEHQVVYCKNKLDTIQLTTGELVVDSLENRKYLKRFNNKYYIKQKFKLSNKNQLLLFK